jgi:hypothetical protein
MIVASFWVHRPVEHPAAFDYPVLLRILQASCDRVGARHVVLTDKATVDCGRWPEGIEALAWPELPLLLMQACTEAQARFLELHPDDDVLFVGADCILISNPMKKLSKAADLHLSYRHPSANYPINNGFMLTRKKSVAKVAALYRRIANRCGAKWCDDQRSIRAELEPMPAACGVHERAGLNIEFVPMRLFNHLPKTIDDPARNATLLHFRGKQHATGQHRKDFMVSWAQRHGFAP